MQLRLKKGHDRRFRDGHPWVFSNELHGTPSKPGEVATLCTPGGEPVAVGYYNSNSLIAFRVLSRGADATLDLASTLKQAWNRRIHLGLSDTAFRWVYGEADGLPGVVIDFYVDHCAVQSHTAGSDALLSQIIPLVQEISGCNAVQIHRDLTHRKHEGITLEPMSWHGTPREAFSPVRLRHGLTMQFDRDQPQKTGLFLDQIANQEMLMHALDRRLAATQSKRRLRVLDLFSYVGQWSCAVAKVLKQHGIEAEFVVADSSVAALELAEVNVTNHALQGSTITKIKSDLVADDFSKLGPFDLVIADPPALIQSRSHLPQGSHAYMQVFERSLRALAPGGWIIASSCSGLLDQERWQGVLRKAEKRSGKQIQWIAKGGLGPDHPLVATFPEGDYLKCALGVASG